MDAISYSYADKQAKRIKKIINDPDSTSGIVTVPKVIASGENITVPAGRVAVLPNVQVDGTLNVEGDVFIPSGSSIDFSTGIKVNGEKLTMSIPTAYHIYNGSVEATNTVLTNGFSTTLYTGNGGTQDINTGVDMATQWGDDVSETFGGLYWGKSRSVAAGNLLADSVNGPTKYLQTNTTAGLTTDIYTITAFTSNGVSLGSSGALNTNNSTNVGWNFQTTHRTSGTTNHGKAYTCHYNPYTGFTMVQYTGSGLAGHEIPHMLGRKLGFVTVKNLSATGSWIAKPYFGAGGYLHLTNAFGDINDAVCNIGNDSFVVLGSDTYHISNYAGEQHILYGWANSYFDEDNTLIGNYEIGVYQGTGVAGNKVTTRGKPAWVMVKRLDSANDWQIHDNQRNSNYILQPNTSNTENTGAGNELSYLTDGFNVNGTGTGINYSGGQYLYMVVYDNDSGSGKSKYPKATDTTNLSINALVPYASGIDTNGSKVSISYKNETISGITLTQGKNYVYSKNDGTYGASSIAPSYGKDNPLTGDFFNLKTLKWYNSSNVEITPRTYLDCIVYADHNGQVSYVEELPKTTYFDEVKANEFKGKNACTAWVNFDLSTTPPTIRDSYNVSAVVRTATGVGEMYFSLPTDTKNYSVCISGNGTWSSFGIDYINSSINKIKFWMYDNSTYVTNNNYSFVSIQVFGGKN